MPCLQHRNRTARFFLVSLAWSAVIWPALTWLALSAVPTFAQELRLQEPQAQSTPSETKGLFNQIGKLLQTPSDLLPSFSKPDTAPAPDVMQQPAPSTPAPEPSATASTRMFPGMVSGREVCPRSANGAPDCQAGTDKLCQSKGYKNGKSLNIDSAFTCSTRQARAEGRKPCGTEHFVTSAFCH